MKSFFWNFLPKKTSNMIQIVFCKGAVLMRRIVFVVLAFAFMLTSCSVISTRSPKDNGDFYIENLPDIGTFSGKTSGRFYDEITYDFIPCDDYGMIIPYIGSYKFYETPKEYSFYTKTGYATYGFCTPDGRIVMDADEKNTYVNYTQTDDGYGFYTVIREEMPKHDAPDEFVPAETLLIPVSGKWCLTLKQNSYVLNCGGGYITVVEYPEDGSQVRTHVYDYDGKQVGTLPGIDSTGIYSHGLMLVASYDNGEYHSSFINESGEIVLGPYKNASDFNEFGITNAEDENGAYLINTKGERLTEYYKSCFREYSLDMKRGLFVGRRMKNNKMLDVYSQDGKLLGTIDGTTYASFRFCDNGEILYYYTKFDEDENGNTVYNSEKMVWKRLSDNTDFVNEELGVSPNSYFGTDNCFIHIDEDEKKAYLFNEDANIVAEIDGATEVVNTSEYGEYVIFITGEYEYGLDEKTGKPIPDTRRTHIYDSNKKEIVFSMEHAGSNAHFADKNKRFVVISAYDSEPENMFSTLSRNWLLDTKSGKIVLEDCTQMRLYDIGEKTYISVCTNNSAALYDETMKLIRKSYFE